INRPRRRGPTKRSTRSPARTRPPRNSLTIRKPRRNPHRTDRSNALNGNLVIMRRTRDFGATQHKTKVAGRSRKSLQKKRFSLISIRKNVAKRVEQSNFQFFAAARYVEYTQAGPEIPASRIGYCRSDSRCSH